MSTDIQPVQTSVAPLPSVGNANTAPVPVQNATPAYAANMNSFAKMAMNNPAAVAAVIPLNQTQASITQVPQQPIAPSSISIPQPVQPSIPLSSPVMTQMPVSSPVAAIQDPIVPQPFSQQPVISIPPQPTITIPVQSPSWETSQALVNPPIPPQTAQQLVQEQVAPPVFEIPTNEAETSGYMIVVKGLLKWILIFILIGLGLKGLFDSLYFILVEFQNFEEALIQQLVEMALINQLIQKATLLVFTTALSVFFALQLSISKPKQLHWLKIIASMTVAVVSFFLLQHANTIHVLDVFKQ